MSKKLNKSFYTTILSQAFSPHGHFLLVGDTFGTISVFHLSKIIQSDTNLTSEDLRPRSTIIVKEGYQVNSLLTTESHLIVGGVGVIYAYSWKNIKASKTVQPAWTIELPCNQDVFDNVDVNCLLYNKESRHIYAGCGDNKIYIYDLETRKLLKTLNNHTDYVHSLCKLGDELLSGAEDGLVNIWDIRSQKVVHKIEPHLDDKVARPELGKWIGAVGCSDDYIVCGGGPRLSLYHYRFLTQSTVFPIEDDGIHVAEIFEDKIFAGGRSRLFYQMSFIGDIISEIPTSAVTTYSAIHQEGPFKVLSIAGSSPKIDLCNNFLYRNQTLSLYY